MLLGPLPFDSFTLQISEKSWEIISPSGQKEDTLIANHPSNHQQWMMKHSLGTKQITRSWGYRTPTLKNSQSVGINKTYAHKDK